MRRQRCDESPQLESISNGLGHAVDNFGGTRACFPLKLRDERHLLQVTALHPLGDRHQRVFERHAELLVCDDPLHLALHRLARAFDDDCKSSREAVARPEC